MKAIMFYKFWSAYLASWEDESILVDPPQEEENKESTDGSSDSVKLLDEYYHFTLKPSKLLVSYKDNKNDVDDPQAKFFVYIMFFWLRHMDMVHKYHHILNLLLTWIWL